MDEIPVDIVKLAGNTLAVLQQSVNITNVSKIICLYEEASSRPDSLDVDKPKLLRQLSNAYLIQSRATGNREGVLRSISSLRQLHVARPSHVSGLCAGLLAEPQITNVLEVVTLTQQALQAEDETKELVHFLLYVRDDFLVPPVRVVVPKITPVASVLPSKFQL